MPVQKTSKIIEKLTPASLSAEGRHITKNVMSPLLWGSAIIIGPCLTAAPFMASTAQYFLVGAVLLVILYVLFFYAFYAFCDRDRLQSEEYRLSVKSMELLRVKGQAPATIDMKAEQIPNTFLDAANASEERR